MVALTACTRGMPSPPNALRGAAARREWRMCAATCAKRITDPSLAFERLLVKDITSSFTRASPGHPRWLKRRSAVNRTRSRPRQRRSRRRRRPVTTWLCGRRWRAWRCGRPRRGRRGLRWPRRGRLPSRPVRQRRRSSRPPCGGKRRAVRTRLGSLRQPVRPSRRRFRPPVLPLGGEGRRRLRGWRGGVRPAPRRASQGRLITRGGGVERRLWRRRSRPSGANLWTRALP